MKQLIIAEKPSVARDLAKVLGATQKHKTHIEGDRVVVTWALGHLLTLKMPEEYNKSWAQWSMESLPMIPTRIGITPLPKTRPQLKAISHLANRKDISEAVIATDAGREGELVARWILEYVKFKKPVKRLWISSQTDKAIKDGLNNLKPSALYDDLYASALARAQADWLIGLNVSRALTVKYKDSLSAGRVQTPTLAMIRQQEERIEKFRPEVYYTLKASVGELSGHLKLNYPKQYKDREALEKLVQTIELSALKVQSIKSKEKTEYAPLPYDLTELQREANQRYQFSAKKTLSIIQSLYETHKIVTYPRTDSKYLTNDMKGTMKERLSAVVQMSPERTKMILKQGAVIKQTKVFQDQKVTDHHGLIPTEQSARLEKLDNDEMKIYRMIVERFIGLFLPPFKTSNETIEAQVASSVFSFKQTYVVDPGFKDVERSNAVHHYKVGEVLKASYQIQKEVTSPPSPLNEAGLLGLMEKHHLGTPATRAEMIEKLISSESVARANSKLTVTAKGKQLLSLVNPSLITPELTKEWELSLEKISKGTLPQRQFIQKIEAETTRLVEEIKNSDRQYIDHSLTSKECPDCGALLKEKSSRDGKLYVCTSNDCSYKRRKDPKVSNKRCPQCKKKMSILENKNGEYFKCLGCQYTEKLVKGSKSKKKMTKHEERKLLKQYTKTEEVESPLAMALKAAMKQD